MAVSTSARLLELYKQILASSGVTVGDNGQCYITMLGLNRALIVDDKAVVLPVDAVMKQFNVEANMAFHPLSESVIRAESAIITKLKQLMTFRLSEVIQTQLAMLVELAADTARHKNLNPDQQVFLRGLPKADPKTAKTVNNISDDDLASSLTSVLDANGSGPKHTVLHMFLKRSGTWKGRKYKRVCIVNFPIMEAEQTKDNTIFGVKVRAADKPAILNLFKYILPGADEAETPYNYGSDSGIAPYFDSLLHSFLAIAKQLNVTTDLFREHITEDMYKTLFVDTTWEDDISDLTVYKGLMGPMDGNIGEQSEEEKVTAAATTKVLQTPTNNNLQNALIQAVPEAPTAAQVKSERKVVEYTMATPTPASIPANPHMAGYPGGMPMMMPQMMPQMMMPQNNMFNMALSCNPYDVNAPTMLVNNGMMVPQGAPQVMSGSAGRQQAVAQQAQRQMMAYGQFGGNNMGYPMVGVQQNNQWYPQQQPQPQGLYYQVPNNTCVI